MKDKKNILLRYQQLFEQFQAGIISVAGLEELHQLLKDNWLSSEIEDRMYRELENQNQQRLVAFDKNKMFRRLEDHIGMPASSSTGRKLPLLHRLMPIAAIFVLVFVVGGLLAYFMNQQFTSEGGHVSFCQIAAPNDSKIKVFLPDSSVVWLNAGSKLTYSTDFSQENRLVFLDGEGYFKIKVNHKYPFIVDADGFLVEGSSSEFNLKAYSNEPTIETVLVEGLVWVNHRTETIASDVTLGRRYKATFYKHLNKSSLRHNQPRLVISPNVDPKPLISWKNDQFIHQKGMLSGKRMAICTSSTMNLKIGSD